MRDRTNNIWYDDRVEQFVDDMLDEAERARFLTRLGIDDALKHKVDLARRIKDSLPGLAAPEMPDAILRNVHRAVAANGNVSTDGQSFLRLVPATLRRVAYTTVGIAACALLLIIVGPRIISVDDAQEPVPTQAEVDRALLEVKQTLAFVSDMGHERADIVNGHVVEPVQKAMSFIFQSENTAEIQ